MSKILKSCFIKAVSRIKLSAIEKKRGRYKRKKFLTSILIISLEFVTYKPKLSFTLVIAKNKFDYLAARQIFFILSKKFS